MSCLNLRLQPAKKAWKSFTSIFQTKLHKLNKSKAIKKPYNKNKLQKAPSKTTSPSSLFLGQQRLLQLKNKRKRRRRALPFGYKRYYKAAAAAPVYVDKLFRDVPAMSELAGCIQKQPLEKKLNDEAGDAGPMLHGVDARAEEFIASFRKEMERQEIIARNL